MDVYGQIFWLALIGLILVSFGLRRLLASQDESRRSEGIGNRVLEKVQSARQRADSGAEVIPRTAARRVPGRRGRGKRAPARISIFAARRPTRERNLAPERKIQAKQRS